jgi:hypothetical protein
MDVYGEGKPSTLCVEGYHDHNEFPFGSDYITPSVTDVNEQPILDIH